MSTNRIIIIARIPSERRNKATNSGTMARPPPESVAGVQLRPIPSNERNAMHCESNTLPLLQTTSPQDKASSARRFSQERSSGSTGQKVDGTAGPRGVKGPPQWRFVCAIATCRGVVSSEVMMQLVLAGRKNTPPSAAAIFPESERGRQGRWMDAAQKAL